MCSNKESTRVPRVCYRELKPARREHLYGGSGYETWSVCFSPDGSQFAWSMGFGEVKLLSWDMLSSSTAPVHVDEGKILRCGSNVWAMAFSSRLSIPELARRRRADRQELLLATGLQDGTIKVWVTSTGQLHQQLNVHCSVVRDLAFVPNGSPTLVSASRDKTLVVWNLAKKDKPCCVLTGPDNWIIKCAVSPDSSMVASVCNCDSKVYMWSLRSYRFIRNLIYDHERCMTACDFSKDSALLAICSFHVSTGWWMDLWDPYSAEILSRVKNCDLGTYEDPLMALCFSPVNFHVALKCRALQIWDMEQDKLVLKSEHDRISSLCCAFHPRGNAIVTGYRDGSVRFWQVPCPVPSLQHLCRIVLRFSVSTFQVMALPLPKKIVDYLTYRNLSKELVL